MAAYRQPSALLTKNPLLPVGAADYEWPAITHAELATTEVRLASAPVEGTPGNDGYQVELDYAWLDLYGWEKARPAAVEGLRAERLADGTLEVSFDPLAGAQRYNLYFGSLDALGGGGYDHGSVAAAEAVCGAPTEDAGGGRLKIVVAPVDQPAINSYLLVTAHVDDVESPAGYDARRRRDRPLPVGLPLISSAQILLIVSIAQFLRAEIRRRSLFALLTPQVFGSSLG